MFRRRLHQPLLTVKTDLRKKAKKTATFHAPSNARDYPTKSMNNAAGQNRHLRRRLSSRSVAGLVTVGGFMG
ncbi:hypothetical protein Hanom_Chr08g00752851 [Helianthus anomalus]